MLNWNISTTEISLNRRGLLVWALIIIIVILVYLGSFTFLETPGLVEMIEGYPDVLITGLGMSPEMFADVNLYHAGLVLLYVLLLASIYAMMLAGGMVTRDVELGTVEFLYTRPVPRAAILVSKAFSFLVLMTLLWIATYLASTAVGSFWVAPAIFDLYGQFTAHFTGYLACLAAGGIAFALAPLLERTQASTTFAVGLGFAFFLLNSLSAMYGQLQFLKYLSLYYYADPAGAAAGEPFIEGMIVLPAVFIAGVAAGAVLIKRKDFTASS